MLLLLPLASERVTFSLCSCVCFFPGSTARCQSSIPQNPLERCDENATLKIWEADPENCLFHKQSAKSSPYTYLRDQRILYTAIFYLWKYRIFGCFTDKKQNNLDHNATCEEKKMPPRLSTKHGPKTKQGAGRPGGTWEFSVSSFHKSGNVRNGISWVIRDPYNDLLQSLYDWVVWFPTMYRFLGSPSSFFS